MNTLLKFGTAAVFGVLVAAAPAQALLTPVEIESFSFSGFGGSTALSFDGFNAGLGTLTEVIVTFSANATLFNTAAVVPIGSGNQAVGSPTPLSAIGTLQVFNFALSIFDSDSLTTPDFVGTVIDNNTVQNIGTAAATLSGGANLVSGLGGFVGGTNLYNLTVLGNATATGSPGAATLLGTNGALEGTVTVQYRYNEPQISTPEPASMVLVGAGLLGLGLARRRRS